MYRFAYRLAGQQQDAEDLVQDVVVKLFPKLDELESVGLCDGYSEIHAFAAAAGLD